MTRSVDARPPITGAQMREVDRLMVAEVGVSLPVMMELAGYHLAALVRARLGGAVAGAHVVVLAGGGNNGGGGLVAARHLVNIGASVVVALPLAAPLTSTVAEQQRAILSRVGVPGSAHVTTVAELAERLGAADVVVDALIGYGLRGAPREPIAGYIRVANAAAVQRVALDVPSGLHANDGVISPVVVHAHLTMTLAWPKRGLLVPGAESVTGALSLADIGVPQGVYAALGLSRDELFARGAVVAVQRAGQGWSVAPSSGDPSDHV